MDIDWDNAYKTIDNKGYIQLSVRIGGKTYRTREHVVVWEKYNGVTLNGYHVHHINGIKGDNRIDNLQLLSPLEHSRLHKGFFIKDGEWYKYCPVCGILKVLSDDNFYEYKNKNNNTYHPACKECEKLRKKIYVSNNQEKVADARKQYYESHKEYYAKQQKERRKNNVELIKEKAHQSYVDNKTYYNEYSKQYGKSHRRELQDKQNESRALSRDMTNQKRREYRALNKDAINEKQREYRKKKRDTLKEEKANEQNNLM